MIFLGKGVSSHLEVQLNVDWNALGLNKKKAKIYIPDITNHQKEEKYKLEDPVRLNARGVKFIVLTN